MLKGRSTACHCRNVNILWNVYLMSKITSKLSEEDSGSKCTIFLKTPSSDHSRQANYVMVPPFSFFFYLFYWLWEEDVSWSCEELAVSYSFVIRMRDFHNISWQYISFCVSVWLNFLSRISFDQWIFHWILTFIWRFLFSFFLSPSGTWFIGIYYSISWQVWTFSSLFIRKGI